MNYLFHSISWSVICLISLQACQPSKKDTDSIIQKTIETHGGAKMEHVKIDYDFRDKHYTTTLKNGTYHYQRTYQDTAGNQYKAVLSNDSLYREVNGQKVGLSKDEKAGLRGSLDAVNYFFLLPYKLKDPVVQSQYLSSVNIHKSPYKKIRVTFKEGGNGQNHQDTFLYWVHENNYTMDFLAYKYQTSGGGMRFRVADNIRTIKGIQFQDYLNLAPVDSSINFEKIDSFYKENEVKRVSEIRKKNIEVTLLE